MLYSNVVRQASLSAMRRGLSAPATNNNNWRIGTHHAAEKASIYFRYHRQDMRGSTGEVIVLGGYRDYFMSLFNGRVQHACLCPPVSLSLAPPTVKHLQDNH